MSVITIIIILPTSHHFMCIPHTLPKVYACGEETGGRLGIGEYTDQPSPKVLSELSTYVVRRVATSAGGRHAMALTADGKVFSWGDGELGQLGHGDNQCVWEAGTSTVCSMKCCSVELYIAYSVCSYTCLV